MEMELESESWTNNIGYSWLR